MTHNPPSDRPDATLNQTVGEQMRAEELSLRATVPPAQIPGYKLDRMLGQGAFGQVWVGTNLNTGRTVAVKFYLHRTGVNWSLLTREVKNLVSMSGNRQIVQVLDVGWDAVPPYFVMEYLESGSLDALIRKEGALPVNQAVNLFTDLARGLNHSHGKGVLHCDLKPANVLLDPELQPRLADFGQSRLSNEQTPSLGTLFYMAPEQADLNAVPDARWDVYALGAILYSMLVGSPPYRNADTISTLDTATSLGKRLELYRSVIRDSPFPRDHLKVPGVDRWLGSIVDRCLAKKPIDRFENVQQVLEAISRRHQVKQTRPLMILGLVGPVLLLLVMSFFFWRGVAFAERESSNELKEMVLQNNLFAATLGARTLEKEIETLFRLIEDEAQQSEFGKRFRAAIDQAGPEMLQSMLNEEEVTDEERKVLWELSERQELESFLTDRFEHIKTKSQGKRNVPEFDSMFVVDRWGTMIAATFSRQANANRIGYNFAFRSYFNGQSQDSSKGTSPRKFQGTKHSHVSVPFLSTSTNRWKIAVSTPISVPTSKLASAGEEPRRGATPGKGLPVGAEGGDGRSEAEERRNEQAGVADSTTGVLVLTINLGDFDLLPEHLPRADGRASVESTDRLAVMVDGHAGIGFQSDTRDGTLLQHPAFVDSSMSGANAPINNYQIEPQVLDRLKRSGVHNYIDPVSQVPEGKLYSGEWIAAMAPVEITRRSVDFVERKEPANLWVLVQARAGTVTAPVARMGDKMMREGFIALFTMLAMICMLWFVVVRGLRLPKRLRSASGLGGGRTGESATDGEGSLPASR